MHSLHHVIRHLNNSQYHLSSSITSYHLFVSQVISIDIANIAIISREEYTLLQLESLDYQPHFLICAGCMAALTAVLAIRACCIRFLELLPGAIDRCWLHCIALHYIALHCYIFFSHFS
jgi:hypothetical protein